MDATLFDQLRQLRLPSNSYAIFGSGPLAIRGIIPACNDLDILCDQDVWDIVSEQGLTEYLPEYDVTVASFFDGAVTFGMHWGIGDFNVARLIETAEIIESLPFVRLKYVIQYKTIRSTTGFGILRPTGTQPFFRINDSQLGLSAQIINIWK